MKRIWKAKAHTFFSIFPSPQTFRFLLYAIFWVIPRRLNFICRRFGVLCSIYIGRSLVLLVSSQNPLWRNSKKKKKVVSPLLPRPFVRRKNGQEDFEKKAIVQAPCLWRRNRQSVPKRRQLFTSRQVVTSHESGVFKTLLPCIKTTTFRHCNFHAIPITRTHRRSLEAFSVNPYPANVKNRVSS
jgi:hypothetical protein